MCAWQNAGGSVIWTRQFGGDSGANLGPPVDHTLNNTRGSRLFYLDLLKHVFYSTDVLFVKKNTGSKILLTQYG